MRGGAIIPFARRRLQEPGGDTGGAALTLQGASLSAGNGRTLLHALDLTVAEGERIAVVGPNGAGKTSLLRLLSGRVAPTQGSVMFRGEAIAGIPTRDRARSIAVVAQGDTPDPRLILRDYVALGRLPHRGRVADAVHAAAVDESLARIGLTALAGRRLENLSGGERQRGAIARAVAQEPTLLLLDEPTNYLDPRARADVLALVRDLGTTVVAVLHDLTLVGPFADRVAVLDQGNLIAIGPPAEALSPSIVEDVFALHCFEVVNPETGRPLLVFDTPSDTRERHDDAPRLPRSVGPVRLRPGGTGDRLSGHG